MARSGDTQQTFKARIIALIEEYFGGHTAMLYTSVYEQMPLEFVEKSSEKILTEYLGTERARALISGAKRDI